MEFQNQDEIYTFVAAEQTTERLRQAAEEIMSVLKARAAATETQVKSQYGIKEVNERSVRLTAAPLLVSGISRMSPEERREYGGLR